MTFDPNNAPLPPAEPTPEEEPQPAPQAPPEIPLDVAADVIAQHYGYDPRLAKYEFEELKRKREELAQRERELETRARQPMRYEPQPEDFQDPGQRVLFQMLKEDREERRREQEERRQEREQQQYAERLGGELDRAYVNLMRSQGLTAEQIEQQREAFFNGAMTELYPEGIPQRLGVEGAVRNTFRYMKNGPSGPGNGGFGGGYSPQPRITPRTPIVIPQGTSSQSQGGVSAAGVPVRQANENDENWGRRVAEYLRDKGVRGLPDGVAGISSG